MASFTFITRVAGAADLERSHVTDLEIIQSGGAPVLISTTRYDGVLRSWDIENVLTPTDERTYIADDLPGGTASIMTLNIAGMAGVLTGGGAAGSLQTLEVGSAGVFGVATALPSSLAGFQHGVTVTLGDGTQAIYGGLAGTGGIGRADFTAAGSFAGTTLIAGEMIVATATADIAGQSYLFTTSASQNNVTSWAVASDGSLNAVQTIGTDDGLWIAAPSAIETATVGGTNYVVLGAAGSSTISVMEVGNDGSLILRDHLLDSLETRFGGVTSIEIVRRNGQTFVIAGGADDGISVFVMLEGGHLLARGHIADTVDMGLDNVSAIAARGSGDGLDIFVASSSEAGLTQLRLATGTAGVTTTAVLAGGLLNGTADNDILQGHDGNDQIAGGGGDDIIRDGAGSDVMTGGAGADVFILTADGVTDTITDFTPEQDTIDLSLWPMLRDISQLAITIQPDGMEIRYGEEVLVVQSADGEMIDYRELTNADLIGGSRVSSDAEPGYPGPATPPPVINPDPTPDPVGDQGDPFDIRTGLGVIMVDNVADLRDVFSASAPRATNPDDQTGGQGTDILIGGAEDDLLSGGTGDDIIMGRAGDDHLIGGDGADLLIGGNGADLLTGGNGHDNLNGGDGADILSGGDGDDLLSGGAGADTFMFQSGTDTITDFDQSVDQITLDPLLWTGLTSAGDVLAVYGSYDGDRATIDLGDGNILHIEGVTAYETLADSIDLF